LPTAKTLNTLVSYLAQRQAQAAGVHESLLYHDGYLTEGASSNLFAVVEDTILTPPDGQVLPGVARDITLFLATRDGLSLRQTKLDVAGVASWSECFITSSSRHVMPITAIDGHPVGDGQVGPNTRRLMALFEDYFLKATSG
jgi:D-alanine transaminase